MVVAPKVVLVAGCVTVATCVAVVILMPNADVQKDLAASD